MGVLDRVLEETSLVVHKTPPFWLFGESKGTRKRPPLSLRRKLLYPYLVVRKTTRGGSSVKLYDVSGGYDKLLASTSGLDVWSADQVFEGVCDIVRSS